MNADIQEVAPCRKRMTVELDSNEVDEAFEASFAEVQNHAQVPGFRRGRVPRRIVERKFGAVIQDEVKNRLFRKGFVDALRQDDLTPLGDPDIDFDNIEVKRGEPFSFTTEVDVRPKFELAEFKGIELEKEVEEVTDAEVEERLEALRQNFADHVPVDEEAKEGYLVEGKVVLTVGDEELFNQEERSLRVEGTTFFGIEVGDMVEHLGGIKVGEERTLTFTMPDTYPRADVRGKEATALIAPKKILKTELPELDDAFASRLGMADMDALKQQIRTSLEMERENQARQQMEEELTDKLIEANKFDLPEALVERQAESHLQQARMRMLYMGTSPDDMEKSEDEMRAQSREDADKQLRRMLILDEIANRENIQITESDFQNHLNSLASAYRTTPAEMLKDIQQRDGMAAMESEIRDIKVTSFLLDNARVNGEEPKSEEQAEEESAPPVEASEGD